MENENRDPSALFQVMRPIHRNQMPRWHRGVATPTCTLLRDPFNLQELSEYAYKLAIWRENDTLTYVSSDDRPQIGQKCLRLSCSGQVPDLYIVGQTDNAIAETAAFFMSLHELTKEISPFVQLYMEGGGLDFRAAGPQCFTRLWRTVPSCRVYLYMLQMSAEQSIALATRPHCARLVLLVCELDDEGAAFVNALQNRQSSFGSLAIVGGTKLHDDNLERLLRIGANKIGHLELHLLKNRKLALLPFSMNVDSLSYCVSAALLLETDFQSLHIPARNLSISLLSTYSEIYPTEAVRSFFRRVADLGHFVELKFHVGFEEEEFVTPDCVVPEVISAAIANPNLKVLDLWEYEPSHWGAHLKVLFHGLKVHQGLCIIKLHAEQDDFGPDFSHLKMLLSHHRNIEVTDDEDVPYLDDEGEIVELYSLNRFYRGSAALPAPSQERFSLVATTLVESALGDFQRSALLLSNHMDALVQFAELDEL